MLFLIGLLAFIVCVIIQFLALHRMAFGRSMFITVMMFVVSFMIVVSPEPIAIVVHYIFLYLAWGFLLFMTWQSIRRFRANKTGK